MRVWPLDPLLIAGLVVSGTIYLRADRRVRTRRKGVLPRTRPLWFVCGLVVILVSLQGPLDARAGTSFTAHMVQHLLLTMIAAPLLVLGAPVALALLASARATRRRLVSVLRSRPARVATNPVFAWALFVVVLWGTHFTELYSIALQDNAVHALEHLLYLVAAVLFWIPVVGVDPSPSRLSHPARILYLFLTMPAMAFLGLALVSASHVLYPWYLQYHTIAGELADQAAAGAIMWAGTMFLIVPALAFVLFDWMRADEQESRRIDARLLRSQEPATASDTA
jgi:putative copper resistance protein D